MPIAQHNLPARLQTGESLQFNESDMRRRLRPTTYRLTGQVSTPQRAAHA